MPRPAPWLLYLLALTMALPAAPGPAAETASPAAARADQAETRAERKQRAKEEKRRRKEETKSAKGRSKARPGRYGSRTVEDLLDEARSELERGKELKAREILLFLEDNEKARDQQDQVKLLLAHSYFEEGGTLNWVEALSRYRTFLTFFPNHPDADFAQYRIGMSYLVQAPKPNRDQSPTENALFEFQKLLELYPNSEWADDAEQRIQEARDLLADHEYEVALFYFKRKEFQAAALRLQTLLAEFPDYAGKAEVYRHLAEAHYRMGDRIEGDVYSQKYRELGGGKEIQAKAASRKERGEKKNEKDREQGEAEAAGDDGGPGA